MKGIILAGGAGTRLHPITRVVSKQLLPVFDKPMIYYPLSTLMLTGVRDVLVISTPEDLPRFQQLLGDGSQWGMAFSYARQPRPDGVAQALVIGADFVEQDRIALILGDNIFHGQGLSTMLQRAAARTEGATIFGYRMSEPRHYGVVELDDAGSICGIHEKPATASPSSYAVAGLYFYDNDALAVARELRPSARGEYEITDVNLAYLGRQRLCMEPLGRGMVWLDAGTCESLYEASSFIETIQKRQGMKVACPEEIAFGQAWIDAARLCALAEPLRGSGYGEYLLSLLP